VKPFGQDNKFLSNIIAVAGHEITSFDKFTFGGKEVTFDSGGNAIGEFKDFMFKFNHLGTDDQLADSDLDANSTKWTVDHRLRGVAYYHLKLVFSRELFPQGFENPQVIISGRKLYDPRKDDTNGGVGPHRLEDPSTWEFSDNPVLAIVDYLRGIRVANSPPTTLGAFSRGFDSGFDSPSANDSYDGTIIAGIGISPNDIDFPQVIAEANICDQLVSVKAGGTEKRYTLNGFLDPRRTHRDILEIMLSTMSGNLVFQAGKWRIYAGAPRVATISRTTDDLVSGIDFRSHAGINKKVNTVRGLYTDETADFELKDYPPITNATFLAEDNGQTLPLTLNLPLTKTPSMAQRLGTIALKRARRERRLSLEFQPVALQDQAMDTINFDHPPLNINNEKFVIVDWTLDFAKDENGNVGMTVKEVLLEESDDIYGFNPLTEESDTPAPGTTVKVNKINDQRAISTVGSAGEGAALNINPLSASENGSTATIAIAAFNITYGFGVINYNLGSISGLATDTDHFVFFDDPDKQGGAVTYQASTDFKDITGNDGRIFIGGIKTPGAGSGGGGSPPTNPPGPSCIAIDQFLTPSLKAGCALAGNQIDVETCGKLISMPIRRISCSEVPCVELITESDIKLTVSISTPITAKDGKSYQAPFSEGCEVMVDDNGQIRWEKLISVKNAGMQMVAHVDIGGRSFAAGTDPNRRIVTHNAIKQPL